MEMTKGKKILFFSTITILGTYFLFMALIGAKAFLIPLVTAFILALLMVPLSQRMEKGFFSRAGASLFNTFILFLVSVGFMALVSFQVKSVVDDWPQIKQTMQPKIEQLKKFVFEHTPVEAQDLEQSQGPSQGQPKQQSQESMSTIPFMGSGSSNGQKAATFFNQVMSFFADYLLTFIYIFFLLNYRNHFKGFLLRLFPEKRQGDVKRVLESSARVTQKYLVGKLMLIGLLALLYSVGLGISGVSNFILISVLAAVLSLIPYIGNIIGFGLALIFGYLTSGETTVLIGVIITFSVAQFVESYILEPYVVGDQVDLHPFFVILAVIIGNSIWGIAGMVLSIPVLAIINVVLINVGPLKPFGFLFRKNESD